MKFILVLATFWSVYASAQETCSTSWIYRPYKSCVNISHGLEVPSSGRGEFVREDYIFSPEYNGGQDQTVVCAAAQAKFNQEQMSTGLQASVVLAPGQTYAKPNPALEQHKEANPIAKNKKDRKDTYRYACKAEIYKFPFAMKQSKVCGVTEGLPVVVPSQKRPANLNGEIQCLTCDGLENAANKGYVACLQRSIAVVNANVSFGEGQVDALVIRARNLISVNSSLAAKDQLSTGEVLNLNSFVTSRAQK